MNYEKKEISFKLRVLWTLRSKLVFIPPAPVAPSSLASFVPRSMAFTLCVYALRSAICDDIVPSLDYALEWYFTPIAVGFRWSSTTSGSRRTHSITAMTGVLDVHWRAVRVRSICACAFFTKDFRAEELDPSLDRGKIRGDDPKVQLYGHPDAGHEICVGSIADVRPSERRRSQSSEGSSRQSHGHQDADSELLLQREVQPPHDKDWQQRADQVGKH